jgi:putative hemolysin
VRAQGVPAAGGLWIVGVAASFPVVEDLLRVVAVLGLVAGNAFFVVGEYAVVTARRASLTGLAEGGSGRAAAVLRLMDDPVRVISTVQVGITAIGILTGAVGEPLVNDLLGGGLPSWLGFLIAFGIVTYLSVVLGELVPKALTLHSPERLAMLVARPIELVGRALRPVVWLLQQSARLVLRPFGVREVVAGETIRSADELRAVVDEAEGLGVIPRAQEELIYNVFDFASREAADVMVPAADVAWLDASLPAAEALERLAEIPHRRVPVGRGSLDRLVGILHSHDLLRAARAGSAATADELARPALIVPETKDLGALLRELRERREQMAVIVSEYGSTSGIVTLEDILEEIVGEIQSEYELPDASVAWVGDRVVDVAGSISVDDFNEAVGSELPETEARTLAGLVFDSLGRGPVEGDLVELTGVGLRVEEVDGPRITRIRAVLPERGPDGA